MALIPKWLRRQEKKTLTDASVYPPVIHTPMGPVTESARHQAAINMRNDPAVKVRVENAIGISESRRRYPECYREDDNVSE